MAKDEKLPPEVREDAKRMLAKMGEQDGRVTAHLGAPAEVPTDGESISDGKTQVAPESPEAPAPAAPAVAPPAEDAAEDAAPIPGAPGASSSTNPLGQLAAPAPQPAAPPPPKCCGTCGSGGVQICPECGAQFKWDEEKIKPYILFSNLIFRRIPKVYATPEGQVVIDPNQNMAITDQEAGEMAGPYAELMNLYGVRPHGKLFAWLGVVGVTYMTLQPRAAAIVVLRQRAKDAQKAVASPAPDLKVAQAPK